LITGGYGFIGRHLLNAVAAECSSTAVLGRGQPDAATLGELARHEFVRADLTDRNDVVEGIRQFEPDIIFHLAAWPDQAESPEQFRACVETNTLGTLGVLEGARRTSAALVVGDSVKSYGNAGLPYCSEIPETPNSSYAISKVAAWNMARLYSELYGLHITCIRPTLIYGPGQGLNLLEYVIDCVWENRSEIALKGGTQTRDPLYISDAVRAYLAAAAGIEEISGKVINIGGGEEYSVHDIAELVVRIAGGSGPIVDSAEDSRPTEIWRSYCDNSEAREALGWEPQVSLEEGIGQILQARREEQKQQLKIA
jgi:UDP-glucose 4-epimerase